MQEIEHTTQPKKDVWLPLSVLIAGVLIAGAVVYTNRGERTAPTQSVSRNVSLPSVSATPQIGDDVVLGDPNAPVTLIEFGDYQCPFCERMFRDTETRLRDEYIKEGKVKMVYKDFPIETLHPYAYAAAEAAECARDQGKYWAYHDLLFQRQAEIPSQKFGEWAGELGMDRSAFESCVRDRKYASEVQGDYDEGVALGVNGTPATFVNGRLISGAQPYAAFKAAIDAELQKSSAP